MIEVRRLEKEGVHTPTKSEPKLPVGKILRVKFLENGSFHIFNFNIGEDITQLLSDLQKKLNHDQILLDKNGKKVQLTNDLLHEEIISQKSNNTITVKLFSE